MQRVEEEGEEKEVEEEEEDPMEFNEQKIYEEKHNPIWLHSKHKVPDYVINGGMGVKPITHKVAVDPHDEWGSLPATYVRTHVDEVQV